MLRPTGALALAAFLTAQLGPAAAGPALLFDASDGQVLYAEDASGTQRPSPRL